MYRALIAAAAVFALTGCNTVAGFGNDVSAVGTALTAAANGSAKPAPAKKQTATKTAAKKTTTTKVAAKSSATKSTTAKTAPKKASATKTTARKTVVDPTKVDVVDTGKPFRPGK